MADLPTDRPIMEFESARAWETWLLKNGATSPGVYIKVAKKGTGVLSITCPEALEVSLCHGWIDAIRKRFDETYFLQKYLPRGPRSIWSEINKKKAQQLIKAKLMHPAGLAAIKQAKANGQWANAYAPVSTITVPPDLEAALKKNKKARNFFETLTSNNRYAILHRLHMAKKGETRVKRLALYVGMLERGETFY